MTRKKQIIRLGSAIRKFRGEYDPLTKVWRRVPQPDAAAEIMEWAKRLDLDQKTVAEKVESFQNIEEYRAWMKTLS